MGECKKSIFKLEKLLEKSIAQSLKGANNLYSSFDNNYELYKFLFRSETTEEWVFGAKELGKLAVEDDEAKGYIESSNNVTLEKKLNTHRKRHFQTALLAYYTESLKKEKKIKITYAYKKKGKTVYTDLTDYYFDIFKNFEIAGIEKALSLYNSDKNIISLIEDNFSVFKKTVMDSLIYEMDRLNNENDKKRGIIKSSKDDNNSPKIEGIKRVIQNNENKIEELKNLSDRLKNTDVFDEKIKEILKNVEKLQLTRNPKKFFSNGSESTYKFESWEVGSIYFAFPYFYEEIVLTGKSEGLNELNNLNWQFVVFGMLTFDLINSAEYLKNGIYILKALKGREEFKLIEEYIGNGDNKKIFLEKFYEKYGDHFAEFIIELSDYFNENPLDLIENLQIMHKKNNIKDIKDKRKEVFKDSMRRLLESINSNIIFDSQNNLKLEKILITLVQKMGFDYDNSLRYYSLAIEKAIKNEKNLIPYLAGKLKYIFYEKLKKVKNDEIIYEVYKQAVITSDLIAEYNTPEAADKHLGTIFANLLQYSYLIKNDELLKNLILIFMYKTPYKKFLKEMSDYISIGEIERQLKSIDKLLNDEKPSKEDFKNLIGFENIFDYSRFDNENEKILKNILNMKFMLELTEDVSYELFNDERGWGKLEDDFEKKTNEELMKFEHLLRDKREFETVSIENIKNINEEIDNWNSILFWISKNLPFHYAKIINEEINEELDVLKSIKSNIDSGNESEILKKHCDDKYEKHHPFFEIWLGKRFLVSEVIENLRKKDRKKTTTISESFFLNKFSSLYLWVFNPVLPIIYAFIPFLFFVFNYKTIGNKVLSIQLTITAFIIPVVMIFIFINILLKIYKWKTQKEKNITKSKQGLGIIDIFYPKMFGIIFISFLATAVTDEGWAVAMNSNQYFLFIAILYIFAIIVFLKKNVYETIGTVEVSDKTPSLSKRTFRLFGIAVLQITLISHFFIMRMSDLMINRIEYNSIIKSAGETVLNIPKNLKIKVFIPDIIDFSVHSKYIDFSPFYLINSILVVLFIGVVLQLYLNNEKLN